MRKLLLVLPIVTLCQFSDIRASPFHLCVKESPHCEIVDLNDTRSNIVIRDLNIAGKPEINEVPGSYRAGIDSSSLDKHRKLHRKGHLVARPSLRPEANGNTQPGLHTFSTDYIKNALFYIPTTYRADQPSAFIMLLHGSRGDAAQAIGIMKRYADEQNLILFAPVSVNYTWDLINPGYYDNDVVYIDHELEYLFKNLNIDRSKLAIGGLSDGASYALSLGLTNGDLFTHVIAFSPGFARFKAVGKPNIFISHGLDDKVLPISTCSRPIVKQLEKKDYKLNFIEFKGGHYIPNEISKAAVEWLKK